ncbi:MAG: branched-chain amino acid transporter permease [Clostridia bacterium]|nr:branched-chain amino acid transporter permease [Clostridia bacterium]
MSNFQHSALIVVIAAVITALLRGLPFIIFSKKTPKFITFLGKFLPYAVMGMLVVYCLKDATFTAWPHALPELIAIAAVALIHLWRRNTLLSVAGGTVFYMILVQCVCK